MAESAVSLVIDRLLPLLTNETKLLTGIHEEVADIKDELESMLAFLRDADMKLQHDHANSGLKLWVKRVRELAFQIEDVIDEYVLHVAQPPDRHGFLRKIARLLKKLKKRHHVASKIQHLKTSVRREKERSDRYSLRPVEQAKDNKSWHDPRVTSLFVDQAELVGIESPKNELVGRLVEGPSENMVISLLGMGGLGKTTLAMKAFEHERISAHFHCFAWITVSQSYNTEQLLKSMIKEFRSSAKEPPLGGIDSMDERLLMSKLREYLLEKRYVVVFDDVWDIDFWEYMKYALPNNNKGSRIIITTRNENVAPSPKESPFNYVNKIQPLPKKEALELFCKKVFQFEDGNCPKELQELSDDFVERCDGLPLAIVAIGGLLATKEKNAVEWRSFYDNLEFELASNQRFSRITRILTLSYHDLPFHLKNCFLYFGVFPEDESIDCERLIRLWLAEGFIRERQGKTLEDVGEEYLAELIQRSLVQVAASGVDGKAISCRVHDLLYDIIHSLSAEMDIHRVFVDNQTNFEEIGRRLSIHDGANSDTSESSSNVKARSMLVFSTNKLPESLCKVIFTSLRLLRVLDFEGAPLDYIPEEIGNLFHLIYLSLRGTVVKMLPKSISKLQNLQTLDLRGCPLYNPSIEVDKLLKLRCLLVLRYDYSSKSLLDIAKGLKICGSIKYLNAIQRLCYIEVGEDVELVRDLEGLSQLRELGILKLKREHGPLLCTALEKMTHLNLLDVCSLNEEEILDLQSITHPPRRLRVLCLSGRLEKMPSWIFKLENLERLELSFLRLDDNPLDVLCVLQNLLSLSLCETHNVEELHFKTGGFQKLGELRLVRCNRLKMVTIEEGALPSLNEFYIGDVPQLKELPLGMHHLSNLRKLYLSNIEQELALGILPGEGPNYWEIEHVLVVELLFTITAGFFRRYRLGDAALLEYLKDGEQSDSTLTI